LDGENFYITTLKGINEVLTVESLSLKEKKYYDFLGIMVLINLFTLPIATILVLYRIFSPIITLVATTFLNTIETIEKSITTGISNQELQVYSQEIEHVNIQLLQMFGNMNNEFMKQSMYMLGLGVLSFFLLIVSMKLEKKPILKKIFPIIASILSSFTLIVFDVRSIFFLIFVLMYLMITIKYKPLGSMKYINFIRCLLGTVYLVKKSCMDINKEVKSKKRHIVINIVLTVCYLCIALFCLTRVFSALSINMGLLITISIFLLVWTNSAQNSTILIFRKFILYISCVPVVILYNNALSASEPLKILSVFVTLFFSIERIINLSKEAKKEVLKEIPEDIIRDLA
jgi:hypothetical protein